MNCKFPLCGKSRKTDILPICGEFSFEKLINAIFLFFLWFLFLDGIDELLERPSDLAKLKPSLCSPFSCIYNLPSEDCQRIRTLDRYGVNP